MYIPFHKKIARCILTTSLVILALYAPIAGTPAVRQAQAQGFLVYDIQNTLTNTLQTLSAAALEQKELVLDPMFFEIAKKALQQMTNDIVKWVNSGFDGDPVFVTDLLGYLEEIADEVAGNFIYGDELSSICTPFQLDVRIALAKQYTDEKPAAFKEKVECTLDDYGNEEAFLSGEFTAGGWGMWIEAVLNPEQTSIGSMFVAQREMDKRIAAKQFAEIKDIDHGRGFRSLKNCNNETGECVITTPGSVIQEQLSFQLTTAARSLIEADEMNEVLGALFSNLANQAITGVNGLLGLGGNAEFSDNTFGASVSLSYLDAMDAEAQESWGGGQQTGSKIEQALVTETKVLEAQIAILTELDAINTAFEDAKEPFEGDSCWNLALPSEFSTKLNDLVEDIPKTIATIVELEQLVEDFEAASSAQAQLNVLNRFTTLQSNGSIAGKTALIQYEFYLDSELDGKIEDFKEKIKDEEEGC
jgi:hypothetical protein